MGACAAKEGERSKASHRASDAVDIYLEEERIKLTGQFKMLLLGTADSGKTTIFKQLLNATTELSDSDKKLYVPIIRRNITNSIKAICDHCDDRTKVDAKSIETLSTAESSLSAQLEAVKTLWGSEDIRKTYSSGNFYIIDNFSHFVSKADAVFDELYSPTFDDVLRSRDSTLRVHHTVIQMEGQSIDLVDIGGQRGIRRKWIHQFDSVDCLLFVSSLSEFDQVLEEDPSTPRLLESLSVFEETINLKAFKNSPIVLLLNKSDLLQEKLKSKKLVDYCPDYKGREGEISDAFEFFKAQFLSRVHNPLKQVFTHITCATDTRNVLFTFNAIYTIVINRVLAERVNFD